ncbi:MAG TPA: hypothetical protein VFU77_03770, partial [Steroidobacteraceae bacterium]|nr:hypothetical protein [Steroidobacteraceae bacterium]
MSRLIAQVLQWILRKLGLLIVIVAILVAASVVMSQWEQHRELQATLEQAATDRMAALQGELDAIDTAIQDFESQSRESRGEYLDLARQAQAARRAANRARNRRDALERAYWWFDDYLNPGKRVELEAARATHAALDRAARAAETARARKSAAVAALRRQAEQLETRRAALIQEMAGFERQLDRQRAEFESSPRERAIVAVKEKLPLALAILAGILLLPVIVKTALYFGVAPLVGRLAPIRILPTTDPPPLPRPARSEVSAALEIAPGEELLVQPDSLQSSSQPAVKRTRW